MCICVYACMYIYAYMYVYMNKGMHLYIFVEALFVSMYALFVHASIHVRRVLVGEVCVMCMNVHVCTVYMSMDMHDIVCMISCLHECVYTCACMHQ